MLKPITYAPVGGRHAVISYRTETYQSQPSLTFDFRYPRIKFLGQTSDLVRRGAWVLITSHDSLVEPSKPLEAIYVSTHFRFQRAELAALRWLHAGKRVSIATKYVPVPEWNYLMIPEGENASNIFRIPPAMLKETSPFRVAVAGFFDLILPAVKKLAGEKWISYPTTLGVGLQVPSINAIERIVSREGVHQNVAADRYFAGLSDEGLLKLLKECEKLADDTHTFVALMCSLDHQGYRSSDFIYWFEQATGRGIYSIDDWSYYFRVLTCNLLRAAVGRGRLREAETGELKRLWRKYFRSNELPEI